MLLLIVGILKLVHTRRIPTGKVSALLADSHVKVVDLPAENNTWHTLKQAGWSTKEIQHVKELTREEGEKDFFRLNLLRESTFTGVRLGTSFNTKLYEFKQDIENVSQYLSKPKQRNICATPTAVFVLGPSSVGKTTMLATLFGLRCRMACRSGSGDCLQRCQDDIFPVVVDDGAIWRDVSDVWKQYAQHKLLSDYYDKVYKPVAKAIHAELVEDWITKYRPCTVAIPEVASSTSKVQKSVAHFESLGYQIRFVAIHAPFQKVFEFGVSRAIREGKAYNPNGYALAIVSIFSLHKTYVKKADEPYAWEFVENTFEKDALPNIIHWGDYKFLSKSAVQDLSQQAPTWAGRMLAKTCGYRINAWSVKRPASET